MHCLLTLIEKNCIFHLDEISFSIVEYKIKRYNPPSDREGHQEVVAWKAIQGSLSNANGSVNTITYCHNNRIIS